MSKFFQPTNRMYRCFVVNGRTGEGVDELKASLKDNKTALMGPSGVGKSTINKSHFALRFDGNWRYKRQDKKRKAYD